MSMTPSSATTIPCRLCGAPSVNFMSLMVLGSHPAGYFRCAHCGLIETETPSWLDRAYSSALSAIDTGAIHRSTFTARLALAVAFVLGLDPHKKSLDFGGGYGVFTRIMRDAGWHFTWYDKFAENLFARGFEGDPNAAHEFVTSFEVLEHLVDVREEFTRLFAPRHRAVLVSTSLHDGHPARDWWFFMPEAGQHVAFYSADTMRYIANEFGAEVIIAPMFTLFVRKDVELTKWKRRMLSWLLRFSWLAYGAGSVLFELRRGRALTLSDSIALRQKVRDAH